MQPIPLLRVFKVMFESYYGGFRLITCPTFGLTRSLVKEFCEHGHQVNRALSNFIRFGPFRFAGGWGQSLEVMGCTLKDNIDAIKSGHGEELIDVIMQWIQVVQLRAMQDVARHEPERFIRMWCTKHWEHWAEYQSKEWARRLSFREDRDLGCVFRTDVPEWSVAVAEKIRALRGLICDTAGAIHEDDDAMWNGGNGAARMESPLNNATPGVTSKAILEEWTPFPAAGGIATRFASGSNPVMLQFEDKECHIPVRKPEQDPVAFVGLALHCEKNWPHGGEGGLLVSETQRLTLERATPAAEAPIVIEAVRDIPAFSGEENADVVMEVDAETVGEGGEGCNTVEPERLGPGPHAALEVDGDQVEAVISYNSNKGGNGTDPLLQDLCILDPVESGPVLPAAEGDTSMIPCALTMTQVQRSSHGGHVYPGSVFLQDDLMCSQWCDSVSDSGRGMHFHGGECRCAGVSGVQHCDIYDSPHVPQKWKGKTITQIYQSLKIEKVVGALPEIVWSAEVEKGEEFVEFFGGSGREVRVHVRSLSSMKRVQGWLDSTVMDFFLNHFWFSLTKEERARIHIMSAEVSEDLERTLEDIQGLWPGFKQKYFESAGQDIDEYVVPYFARNHWSLLIFQWRHLYHFDSDSVTGHQLHGEDYEFSRRMYVAWSQIRGLSENGALPPVVSVDVYPRGPNKERGHGIVRQVSKYLKV